MKTNIEFIKENLPFSLQAVKDTAGNWFIGYNYTFSVYNGLSWTQQMADSQLIIDMERAKNLVYKNVKTSYNLSGDQIMALMSIIIAVGFEKLMKEDFFVAINSGNKVTIHKAFMHYSKKHRTVCTNTLAKRHKEYHLFMGNK